MKSEVSEGVDGVGQLTSIVKNYILNVEYLKMFNIYKYLNSSAKFQANLNILKIFVKNCGRSTSLEVCREYERKNKTEEEQ